MLVSIIIPNYNKSTYIAECLDSCLKQGKYLKEVIIVDDHSTDNSWEILKKYSSKYPKLIRLFKNPKKGACSARNLGIEKSKGEFIQFLDSDDLLGEEKLENQVKHLLSGPKNKVAVCGTVFFLDGENPVEKNPNLDEDYFLESNEDPGFFLARLYGGVNGKGSMVAQSAWLTPKEVIDKAGLWNETLLKDQDGEFFARVLLNSKGVVYTSQVYNYYRKFRTNNNIANNRSYESSKSLLEALHLKRNHLFSYSNLPESRKGIARLYLEAATGLFSHYRDLSLEAEQHYKMLKCIAPTPVIGGPVIEMMKKILGWKRTLKIKAAIKKYI